MPTYPTRTLTLDDATVATLDTYINEIAIDQLFDHSLVLGLLWNSAKEPGIVGPSLKALGVSGTKVSTQAGRIAVLPVAFQSATSVTTFRGTQTVSTPIDPVMTEAFSKWAYYTGYEAISLTESLENSGPEAVLDIAKERVDMLYRTFSERLETDFWSANTDIAEGTQDSLPGVRTYNSTSPASGNVWGLDRGTYTFWRNQADTVGSFATNGLDKMRSMYVACSSTNSVDPPSLIVTTPTIWSYYVKQGEGIHRVTGEMGNLELSTNVARYMGRPIVHTSKCASGSMHFWNLNYWRLLTKKGADWMTYNPPMPNDQLISHQMRVVWGGTWGITRPARQGVLSSITA